MSFQVVHNPRTREVRYVDISQGTLEVARLYNQGWQPGPIDNPSKLTSATPAPAAKAGSRPYDMSGISLDMSGAGGIGAGDSPASVAALVAKKTQPATASPSPSKPGAAVDMSGAGGIGAGDSPASVAALVAKKTQATGPLAPYIKNGQIDLMEVAMSHDQAALNEAAVLYGADKVKLAIQAVKVPVTTEQYLQMGEGAQKSMRIVLPVSLDRWNQALAENDTKFLLEHYPETKGVSEAAAAQLGAGVLGRTAHVQPTGLEQAASVSRGITGGLVEMIPFSQFWLPGRLEQYKQEGALGWTKLAAYTLLDLSLIGSLGGGLAKVGAGALRRFTPGGKIAALGGQDAVKALVTQAEKAYTRVVNEIPVAAREVRAAQTALKTAIKQNAPDIALRQEAAKLAQQELKALKATHPERLATAQANTKELKALLQQAEANPTRIAAQEKAFKAGTKAADLVAKVGPGSFKAYGVMQGGITLYEWKDLSTFERAAGLGMSALALGVPGKVLGALKSGGEVAFSPGRIPHRAIAVPEKYVPGTMGMPKTTVKGLPAEKQVEAMEISSKAMKELWEGKEKVHLLWPTKDGKKLVYAPRSRFQKVVPKASISATPAGEAFDRPIYAVITVREPAQYFSVWGFPKFTVQSAAGVKGGKPAYLVLFSDDISGLPKSITKSTTPAVIQRRTEELFASGKAAPGEYPGYKLYKGSKEPEFTVPTGTEVGRITGGEKLWTRASPFGPRIELQPHFILAEEAARRTGFTKLEAALLKKEGIPAEVRHYIEAAQFWKRGIANESGALAALDARLSRLLDRQGKAIERLASLEGKSATPAKISAARARLYKIQDDIIEADTRLRFNRAIRELKTNRALRKSILRGVNTGSLHSSLRRVRDRSIERSRAVLRGTRPPVTARVSRLAREDRAARESTAPRDERPPRDQRPQREPPARDERPPRDDRPPRDERPPRDQRTPPRERPARVPETPAPHPTSKKKPVDVDTEIVEAVGVPENPGTIVLPQGIVDWRIKPPYREGTQDLEVVARKEPLEGEKSPHLNVRVEGGEAPERVTLILSSKAAVDIMQGRKLRYYQPQRGPGLITMDGKFRRQKRGTLIG